MSCHNWFFPCRVQFYDVIRHLEERHEILWNQPVQLQVGDAVYIYVGSPYSAIKFKCIVSQIDVVDAEVIKKNSYAVRGGSKNQKFALLRLEKEFLDNEYPIRYLRENGHNQYQKQCHINDKLVNKIEKR